jgi:hypothetical protein
MRVSDCPLIEAGDTRGKVLNREALLDEASAGVSETLSECLVGEEREDLRGKVGVVRTAMEQSGVLLEDDLGDASHRMAMTGVP